MSEYTYATKIPDGSTSNMTIVNTNMGLSIPAYMKFACDVDVRPVRELARGAFGVVHVAEPLNLDLRRQYQQIVMKQLIKKSPTESDLQLFFQEVSIMALLKDHPNIAKIVGYTENPYCILMVS